MITQSVLSLWLIGNQKVLTELGVTGLQLIIVYIEWVKESSVIIWQIYDVSLLMTHHFTGQ